MRTCEYILSTFHYSSDLFYSTILQNPLYDWQTQAVTQVQSADNNKEWCTTVHFLSKKTINLAKQQNQWNISYSPVASCCFSHPNSLSLCDTVNDNGKIGNNGHSAPSPFSQEQGQQRGFPGVKTYKKHTHFCCFNLIAKRKKWWISSLTSTH